MLLFTLSDRKFIQLEILSCWIFNKDAFITLVEDFLYIFPYYMIPNNIDMFSENYFRLTWLGMLLNIFGDLLFSSVLFYISHGITSSMKRRWFCPNNIWWILRNVFRKVYLFYAFIFLMGYQCLVYVSTKFMSWLFSKKLWWWWY